MDSLGRPQSVLLLGATSDIGQAICRRSSGSLSRLLLAGRPSAERDALVGRWQGQGVATTAVDFDASVPADHERLIHEAFASGDIDLVVLAFGVLGDQAALESDPAAAAAAVSANYVGAVSSGLAVASELEAQGHGVLVVLSSVAGERARRSNYIYGSSKAGVDVLANGLADRLHGSGAHVLIVRPGFVRTSMTSGMRGGPLAVGAEDVAEVVVRGIARGSRTVYVPAAMRLVMLGLRATPGPVFRRLPI
ncbi:MAG: SDR family NAD(P)-dependent oxidoreductase [Candidatus Nanopelagicales bacterium]